MKYYEHIGNRDYVGLNQRKPPNKVVGNPSGNCEYEVQCESGVICRIRGAIETREPEYEETERISFGNTEQQDNGIGISYPPRTEEHDNTLPMPCAVRRSVLDCTQFVWILATTELIPTNNGNSQKRDHVSSANAERGADHVGRPPNEKNRGCDTVLSERAGTEARAGLKYGKYRGASSAGSNKLRPQYDMYRKVHTGCHGQYGMYDKLHTSSAGNDVGCDGCARATQMMMCSWGDKLARACSSE